MADPVLLGIDPEAGVATLTLNRPEVRNSISIALLEAMMEALTRLSADESVRIMILAGAGESFCAGADLAEVRGDRATIEKLLMRLSHVLRTIHRLPIPTIALVRGAAIGGGFGLMLVTDFAIAHPEARIGYPPLETGLCPAVMAPWLVSRVGSAAARDMLLRGGTVSGEEAQRLGIVTQLVDKADLDTAARSLARQLARGGRSAMSHMKRFLNELDATCDDELLDRAARLSADVVASEETQQRLRAIHGAG
jgi:enoyl-CoA hydratase/carnithine racemase